MLKRSRLFLCALCLGLGCLFTACSDSDDRNADEFEVDFQCKNNAAECSCTGNGIHCLSDDVALTCKDGFLNRIRCTEKACNSNSGCIGESFNNDGDNKVSGKDVENPGNDAE